MAPRRREFETPEETEAYLEGKETGRRPRVVKEGEPPPAPAPAAAPAVSFKRSAIPGGDGFWGVVVLVLLIGLFAVLDGYWGWGVLIAGLGVVLVGAVFPPLALGFAGLILLYLLVSHGPHVIAQLQQASKDVAQFESQQAVGAPLGLPHSNPSQGGQ